MISQKDKFFGIRVNKYYPMDRYNMFNDFISTPVCFQIISTSLFKYYCDTDRLIWENK